MRTACGWRVGHEPRLAGSGEHERRGFGAGPVTMLPPTRKPCDQIENALGLFQASDVHDRQLTPEAQRALDEAAARRAAREKNPAVPQEVGGREGPEPTRFGDWEKGGLASDF